MAGDAALFPRAARPFHLPIPCSLGHALLSCTGAGAGPVGLGALSEQERLSPVLPMAVPVCVALPALPHNHPLVPHLYPTQRLRSLGALSSSLPSSLSPSFCLSASLVRHRADSPLLVVGVGDSLASWDPWQPS